MRRRALMSCKAPFAAALSSQDSKDGSGRGAICVDEEGLRNKNLDSIPENKCVDVQWLPPDFEHLGRKHTLLNKLKDLTVRATRSGV